MLFNRIIGDVRMPREKIGDNFFICIGFLFVKLLNFRNPFLSSIQREKRYGDFHWLVHGICPKLKKHYAPHGSSYFTDVGG